MDVCLLLQSAHLIINIARTKYSYLKGLAVTLYLNKETKPRNLSNIAQIVENKEKIP